MTIASPGLRSGARHIASDVLSRVLGGGFLSFAQNFEDLQIEKILGRSPRNYLDIGCSEPVRNSVTVSAYFSGSAGTTVDVLEEATESHRAFRPRDRQVTAAVGKENSDESTIFVASRASQTTVDNEVGKQLIARRLARRAVGPPSIRLQELLDGFRNSGLDLLSIDAEGAEADILLSCQFEGVRPKLLVHEYVFPPNALAQSNKMVREKNATMISAHLGQLGYEKIYDDGLNAFWADAQANLKSPTPPTFYDNFVRFDAMVMALRIALEDVAEPSELALEELIGPIWSERLVPVWAAFGKNG